MFRRLFSGIRAAGFLSSLVTRKAGMVMARVDGSVWVFGSGSDFDRTRVGACCNYRRKG